MTVSIDTPEYPPLREAADVASAAAQTSFMRLSKSQLCLLCLVAFQSGLSFQAERLQHMSAWAVCIVMILTLVISSALRIGKFDDRWFRCRAYAENFKSAVWRYVMSDAQDDAARTSYMRELDRLRERLPDLQSEFVQYGSAGGLFTSWMQETRNLELAEKVNLYHRLRVDDQETWYTQKAMDNKKRETGWFWAVFVTEFVAITCAAFQAVRLPQYNPVAGIAALGMAMIAWSQLKRFSDLATSYAIAAGDLRRINEAHCGVSRADVDALVDAVETAVSREHSMWLARRALNC